MSNFANPAAMPLTELRATRAEMQAHEDVLSYVRRIVQTRIDFISAELLHREGALPQGSGDLPDILSSRLNSGPARPPRPASEASDHPLAIELDLLCDRLGVNHLSELSSPDLDTARQTLIEFESARSHERRDLFVQLDVLSAELVRRYRSGEASVDGLLNSDDEDDE